VKKDCAGCWGVGFVDRKSDGEVDGRSVSDGAGGRASEWARKVRVVVVAGVKERSVRIGAVGSAGELARAARLQGGRVRREAWLKGGAVFASGE